MHFVHYQKSIICAMYCFKMGNHLLPIFILSSSCFLVEGLGNFRSYNNDERPLVMSPITHREGRGHDFAARQFLYDASWESLDRRPLPNWYDESKIGIFIHWGVYSVPALGKEWFWNLWKRGESNECEQYMGNNYKPRTTYQELAPEFSAASYDPKAWSQLFAKSGARYVVLTSKHHEGYTLWPSAYSWGWNSKDVGAKRDLVGELGVALKTSTKLRFGLFHSVYEWYNPLWIRDFENNFTTTEFVDYKIQPSLYELVNQYHPDVLWSDGEWEAPSSYWKTKEFLTWLYNESPVKESIVTNDRWGKGTLCNHGGVYTCADHYIPGKLQAHKWENFVTLDKTWGYRRGANVEDYLTPEKLITSIIETVSCGGNVLINIGPTKEGLIPPIQQERLLQMGEWLEVNGPAVYNSKPWKFQNDSVSPGVWYTAGTNGHIYAVLTEWPSENTIELGSIGSGTKFTITMLGYTGGNLSWVPAANCIHVTLPPRHHVSSKWAWTLVFATVEANSKQTFRRYGKH